MTNREEVNGFVRAAGPKLVNGDGQEIILRGVGLGSWFLPEGYMWRFPEQGDRPRRIEAMIESLIGSEKAEQFWETYYDRYIAEEDIRRISEEGFNSIRIPLNARAFIEDEEPVRFKASNLNRLDRVIEWCKIYKLYIILDLHGAPGGQTGANIDDSENDQPELFMNETKRHMTIELSRQLAERYKDEWIIACYDLLNEPLPDWNAAYYKDLMPLYKDIVKVIREVDKRHLITLEGAHWSTDWSIFGETIDDNVLLQFHKYWNNPDTESIQKYLDKREEWNMPIFMGEGGENNTDWYKGAFRLFEDHHISWNFWTWKKMDTTNSPCSIHKPEGWDLLVSYLQGGNKPDAETAESILWTYLDNLPLERCTYRKDVVESLFRRVPIQIPAVFYGYRGEGESYGIHTKSEQETGFRLKDGTDIRFVNGESKAANFHHGGGAAWKPEEVLCLHASPQDWFEYEFMVGGEVLEGKSATTPTFIKDSNTHENTNSSSCSSSDEKSVSCSITVRGSSTSSTTGGASITVNGRLVGEVRFEGMEWSEVKLAESVVLPPGLHSAVVQVVSAPIRLEWIRVDDEAESSS